MSQKQTQNLSAKLSSNNSSSPTVSDCNSTTALVAPGRSAPKSSSKPGFIAAFLQSSKHPYTYGFDSVLMPDAKQQKASSSSSPMQEPNAAAGQLTAKYANGAPSKSSK